MVDRNAIWDWLGAFTGVIFVVIVVVGAAIVGDVFGDLSPDVPSSQMARLLEASRDQMEVGATVSLFGLLFFFLVLGLLTPAAAASRR